VIRFKSLIEVAEKKPVNTVEDPLDILDLTSFGCSGGWTKILGHYHVVCKVIASFTASEHNHQNKRAKAGQQLFRTKVVSARIKFLTRSCLNRSSVIMFLTERFW